MHATAGEREQTECLPCAAAGRSRLQPVPAILEIPSKDLPYDPSQDSILARVKFMFGEG